MAEKKKVEIKVNLIRYPLITNVENFSLLVTTLRHVVSKKNKLKNTKHYFSDL